jgi:hypothetical protein
MKFSYFSVTFCVFVFLKKLSNFENTQNMKSKFCNESIETFPVVLSFLSNLTSCSCISTPNLSVAKELEGMKRE